MLCIDETNTDLAHGKIEQLLKGRALTDEFTKSNGYTVLISGHPGAGKTTLGLSLLKKVYEETERLDRAALMLSLVESSYQIEKIAQLFGLSFRTQPTGEGRLHLLVARYSEEDKPDLEEIFNKIGQKPQNGDVVLIDGIGVLITSEAGRRKVVSFIDQIKRLGLFAILVSEEHSRTEDGFLEYAVDGIIHVGVDLSEKGHVRRRYLDFVKWRWNEQYRGWHTFRLQDKYSHPQKAGVIIFPSVDVLIRERTGVRSLTQDSTHRCGYPSGVRGLDSLVQNNGGPFTRGDRILVIGAPGTGKSMIGAQFLAAARATEEKSVFLSFAGDFDEIRHRLQGLGEPESTPCYCLHYSPTDLVLDEVMGALHNRLAMLDEPNGDSAVIRLFVDGISELRCLFDSTEGFEHFIRSLLRLLETFPRLLSMLSFQVPKIFSSYADVSIPLGGSFTTIIGLNFQEEHNFLRRGLVVLKCLGRRHDQSLKMAEITHEGTYGIDQWAGWTSVGLLGGQPEQIHKETPFVKLFIENRSEEEVINGPFEDFKARYPEDQVFKLVTKPNPDPNHWSFLGYFGAGHSNTKIIALRKYVIDEIRDRDVLLTVPPDFVERFAERYDKAKAPLWSDCESSETSETVLVPDYVDLGVLVYQRNVLAQLLGTDPKGKVRVPTTWKELLDLKSNWKNAFAERSEQIRFLFVIPNTVTDAKNFIAFFFELCWSHGWRYRPQSQKSEDVEQCLIDWVESEYFLLSLSFLLSLVDNHLIPNPTIGGHYHQSVFARRWFSKIQLKAKDAFNRAGAKDPPFQFGIAPLPRISVDKPGISCVDLYALAILKGALAPETGWMLATELVAPDVDMERAKRKRGLPIVMNMFHSADLQANLRAPTPSPDNNPSFHNGLDCVFQDYAEVLSSILYPGSHESELCQKTCDIRRFFQLERALAEYIPRLFDSRARWSEQMISSKVKEQIAKIYKN